LFFVQAANRVTERNRGNNFRISSEFSDYNIAGIFVWSKRYT
jgi:hypothetical protein